MEDKIRYCEVCSTPRPKPEEPCPNTDCSECQVCPEVDDCGTFCHNVLQTRYQDGHDLLKTYRNSYVTVMDENRVYHVDGIGNPIPVSSVQLSIENFDTTRKFRDTIVVDFVNNIMVIYDTNGDQRFVELLSINPRDVLEGEDNES